MNFLSVCRNAMSDMESVFRHYEDLSTESYCCTFTDLDYSDISVINVGMDVKLDLEWRQIRITNHK